MQDRQVPDDLRSLLASAFDVVDNRGIADDLRALAFGLYEQAYNTRLWERTAEDNRPEHELIVLGNTVRVCWRSGEERSSGYPFTRSELRVAVATAILHDLRFIPRITEEMILAAERGDKAEADRLRSEKSNQRTLHMRGGCEDALDMLHADSRILTDEEIRMCVGYIGLHDIWKLGWPYPASSDWLAVCCLEGDALWPLDPRFGVRADLERKGAEITPEALKEQASSNLTNQLRAYRKNFRFTGEQFQDDETIIRTSEGGRILAELRDQWGI